MAEANRLSKFGWEEGRSVDHRPSLRKLEQLGHVVAHWFPRVIGEFDGLTLRFRDSDGSADEIVLSVSEAARLWLPDTVAYYGERAGCLLLPIGYTYNAHLLLLVSEHDVWYGGYDDGFWKVGDSSREAMDQLVIGSGFDEVDSN